MSLRVRLWRTKQSHAPRDVIPAQAGIQNPPFWKGGKGDFKVLSPLEGEIRACPEPCPELAEGSSKDCRRMRGQAVEADPCHCESASGGRSNLTHRLFCSLGMLSSPAHFLHWGSLESAKGGLQAVCRGTKLCAPNLGWVHKPTSFVIFSLGVVFFTSPKKAR